MQPSWSLYLINVVIFVISVFVAKPQITYNNPLRNNIKKGTIAFFLLLMINSVFAFWAADTYYSWEGFIVANQYQSFEILGYEQYYNWLATAVGNDYLLWRACIWIPACLFMYWSAKRLDLLNRNFLVAMLLFGSWLSYTRGMLGHTMLVFGAVLFMDKKSNTLTKIIGLALVGVSYYFHKSMFVNIIFAVLALFPFGKKTVVASLIAFPFLTMVATYLINGISSGQIEMTLGEGVGGVGDRTKFYAQGTHRELNAMAMFGLVLANIPQYLTLFYLYNRVMVEKIFGGGGVSINTCLGLRTLRSISHHCFILLKHRLGFIHDSSIWHSSQWSLFWGRFGLGKIVQQNGQRQSFYYRQFTYYLV